MKKTLVSVAATTLITTAISSQAFAETYKVQSGDSLWSISNKYAATISELKQWNNLQNDLILPNQVLTVSKDGQPAKSTVKVTQTPAPSSKTYTVKSGDTLSAIAAKNNISLADLQAWNNITSYLIYPGDVLKVSNSSTVVDNVETTPAQETKPSTSNPSTSQGTYTVKSGDSLWKISSTVGVSIADLKKLNNLTSDMIFIGQKLVVSSQSGQVTTPPPSNVENETGFSVQKLISEAKKVVGAPYKWAGTTPAGFDCSGFIYYAFSQAGLNMPRTSSDGYYSRSYYVTKPQPGDLVFFENTYKSGISHLGIYIGNNQFINASDNGVQISSLDSSYWKSHFDGFKRLYEVN